MVTSISRHPVGSNLSYTYVPNTCGANAKGYNDEEYPYEKGPTIYRIVIIGDSVAAGLSKTEKFGKILEQQLNEECAQFIM